MSYTIFLLFNMASSLEDIGEHCAFEECKQKDFCPIKCESCKKNYCKKHIKTDKHKCNIEKEESHKQEIGSNYMLDRCPVCNEMCIEGIICNVCKCQFCTKHRAHEDHENNSKSNKSSIFI